MKIEMSRYQKLTGLSLPQLAERMTGNRRKKKFNSKTLWNWTQRRYDFRVVIECDDNDIDVITGVFKEHRIV